jgi:sugar (pentulose or hexulose) kinase
VYNCLHNPGGEPIFDQGKYLMLQTAMRVRDGLKLLLSLAADKNQKIPDRMTVTGGQASNDGWNQMKANVTGMTIAVPECSDAELLGDAVFAFTGMGLFSSVQEGARRLCSTAKIFEPEAI